MIIIISIIIIIIIMSLLRLFSAHIIHHRIPFQRYPIHSVTTESTQPNQVHFPFWPHQKTTQDDVIFCISSWALNILTVLFPTVVSSFDFQVENSGRTVQYKLNAQSLRLFGLHSDVNDAYRAGANRLPKTKHNHHHVHHLGTRSQPLSIITARIPATCYVLGRDSSTQDLWEKCLLTQCLVRTMRPQLKTS